MEEKDIKIGIKTVWILLIGNLILTIISVLAKIQQLENLQIFLTVGLLLFFSTWIVIISDIVRNKIYNKTFWIVTMFIIPGITPVFYLIQRKKLLRAGQKI